MLIKRLILLLVRWRLGLKKYEPFQFAEQKSDAVYYFSESGIMKAHHGKIRRSSVSLTWLLDDGCVIRRCDDT